MSTRELLDENILHDLHDVIPETLYDTGRTEELSKFELSFLFMKDKHPFDNFISKRMDTSGVGIFSAFCCKPRKDRAGPLELYKILWKRTRSEV